MILPSEREERAMTRQPATNPPEADERCAACGAKRPDPRQAAAAPAPTAGRTAPVGTHCEWCGAEFPDDADERAG
jgi:hypothetical protein